MSAFIEYVQREAAGATHVVTLDDPGLLQGYCRILTRTAEKHLIYALIANRQKLRRLIEHNDHAEEPYGEETISQMHYAEKVIGDCIERLEKLECQEHLYFD